MYNLAFSTAFHSGFRCMFTFFFLVQIPQLTVFVELVTVIESRDTFNLSIGFTTVPLIRVPRV